MFNVLETMNASQYYSFFKEGMKVKTNPGLSIFDNRKDLEIKEATIIEVAIYSPLKMSQTHLDDEDRQYSFMSEEWEIANRSVSVQIRIDKLDESSEHLLVGDVFNVSDIIIAPGDVECWRVMDSQRSHIFLSGPKRMNRIKQSEALVGQLYLAPLKESDCLNFLRSPLGSKLPSI